MRKSPDIFVANDPRANTFLLPGRLVSEKDNATLYMAADLEDVLNEPVAILGMYRLDGVKLLHETESGPIYYCDWTMGDYIRLFFGAVAARTDQSKPVKVYGNSYGANAALNCGVVDAALGINEIGTIVANMPTNLYHLIGQSYDELRDIAWMAKQYRNKGRIDMGALQLETRRDLTIVPTIREATCLIPRAVPASHTMPLENVLPGITMPVPCRGLSTWAPLSLINARKHIMAGGLSEVTDVETTRAIHGQLSPEAAGEFVLMEDVQHDYMEYEAMMAEVGRVATRLMAA